MKKHPLKIKMQETGVMKESPKKKRKIHKVMRDLKSGESAVRAPNIAIAASPQKKKK